MPCPKCSKSFSSSGALKVHILKVHSAHKACPHCKKSYVNIKKHLKQEKCKRCQKFMLCRSACFHNKVCKFQIESGSVNIKYVLWVYPKSKIYLWEDKSSTSCEINFSWIDKEYRVRFAFGNCKNLWFSRKEINLKQIFLNLHLFCAFWYSSRFCSHISFPKAKWSKTCLIDHLIWWFILTGYVWKRDIYIGDDDELYNMHII